MEEQLIWNYLYSKINNPYGAAALMGNLCAESRLSSYNLQNTFETKLNMTDDQYTAAVDSGAYTNFVDDGAGYGLAQWTHPSRKRKLLEYAVNRGTSIGDLNMQLDFLWNELQNYKDCLNLLKTEVSVEAASDAVIDFYEKPKNRSNQARQKRAAFCHEYYNKYVTQREGMSAMQLNTFLSCVEKNAKRVKAYQLGHDGSDGTCDCIGLIIGAVRLSGEKWPWTHGSNYTARYLLRGGVKKNAALNVGDLVFKGRAPGETGYSLPDRYKSHDDKTDYYHVGVVVSLNPFCIKHCTGVPGGIKLDSSRGKWLYSGQLKLVSADQKGDDQPMQEAYVYASNNQPVRVRTQPNQASSIKTQLAVGTKVFIINTNGDWSYIQYLNKNGQNEPGYMMTKFLKQEAVAEPDPATADTLAEIKKLLQEVMDDLSKAVKLLDKLD